MAEEREAQQNSIQRADIWTEFHVAMNHESMHMERQFCLAMTHERMLALEVRIHNLDRILSLYPIARFAELMPCCMLTRRG